MALELYPNWQEGLNIIFDENDWNLWPYFKDIPIELSIEFVFFNILVKIIDKKEWINLPVIAELFIKCIIFSYVLSAVIICWNCNFPTPPQEFIQSLF